MKIEIEINSTQYPKADLFLCEPVLQELENICADCRKASVLANISHYANGQALSRAVAELRKVYDLGKNIVKSNPELH